MANKTVPTNEDVLNDLLVRLIADLEIYPQPEKLLARTLRQNEGLRNLHAEVLARMRPDERLETKEAAFGNLTPGDEFLLGGVKYRAVAGGGTYAAVALDGPSQNILHWPGAQARVQKIIK
jgi:hypothetical protein